MKVKYRSNQNFKDLVADRCYTIISILMVPQENENNTYKVMYRILGEDGVIGLYPANTFEIVEPNLEKDWIFHKTINGGVEILPESIAYESFWEDFFDDRENALHKFEARFPELKSKLF